MQRDPGLQPERTALAWRRTSMAMIVNGLLVVRAGADAGSVFLGSIGGLVLAAGGAVAVLGWQRRRSLLEAKSPTAPHARAMQFMLAATLLACVAAVLSFVA